MCLGEFHVLPSVVLSMLSDTFPWDSQLPMVVRLSAIAAFFTWNSIPRKFREKEFCTLAISAISKVMGKNWRRLGLMKQFPL